MKKLVTLILVLGVILCVALSASASMAGESITIDNPSENAGFVMGDSISVSGSVAGLDISDGGSYKLYCDTSSEIVSIESDGTFSCSVVVNTTGFVLGTNRINFSLEKTDQQNFTSLVATAFVRVTITAPHSTEKGLDSVTLSSGHSTNSTSTSYTSPVNIDVPNAITTIASITAVAKDTKALVVVDPQSFSLPNPGVPVPFNVVVTAQAGGTPATYYYTVTRQAAASINADLNTLTIGSTPYTPNASATQSVSVANSVTTIAISAVASDVNGATVKIHSNHTPGTNAIVGTNGNATVNLNVGANPFRVEVTAASGAIKNYLISITREAATTTLVNSVTLRSGSATGTPVGTAISTITTANLSTARSIQIPASSRSTTTFYAVVALPTGSITGATFTGTGVNSSVSNNTVTLTIPSTTTSATLTLAVAGYSIPITITRETSTNILNSVTLRTASGSSGGSLVISDSTTLSGNSSATLTVPSTYSSTTNFYVNWTVPTGVTVTGVTWQSSGSSTPTTLGNTSGSSYFTMSTSTTTGTLKITATATDNTSYTATITVNRASTTPTILSSVSLRTSSGSSGGSQVVIDNTAISGNTSRTLTVPSSNSSTTNFYVNWTAPTGVTVTGVTWQSSGSSAPTTLGTTSGSSYFTMSTSTTSGTLKITATVSGTSYTATITVNRSSSTTATLSKLYIKDRVNSSTSNYLYETYPATFSSTTYNYTVYVEEGDDTIYIYPIPNDSSATISISGDYNKRTDYYSNSSGGYFEVELDDDDDNIVNLKVEVGSVTNTYKLTIEREKEVDSDVALDSLEVSRSSTSTSSSYLYDLEPEFSPNRLTYNVELANSVKEVYIHLEKNRSNATITPKNANLVSDGVYRATLNSNRTTKAEFTIKYSSKSEVYIVNLNCGSASSDAQLSNLRVARSENNNSSYQYNLAPSFSSSTMEYVALVPYSSANNVYVQATLDDTKDTLTVDGEAISSGNWKNISISRTKSTSLDIEVSDDDGNDSTYELTIVAAPKNADDDATLDKLSVQTSSSSSSAIGLGATFSSTVYKYTANSVANTVSSLRVYPEANGDPACVLVNDTLLVDNYVTVDLVEGSNTIKVVVYAEDCETYKTYEVVVNRGAVGGSDSTLVNLEVRYGTVAGQTLNLIPGFTKNLLTYTVNVDSTVSQISFRPTASDSTATIKMTGVTETSGQWTSFNALNAGSNTYIFTVTSGNGVNTSIYTVKVTRGLNVVISPQKLKVNGVEVTCAAYNINENNYFKLRDIAYAVRDTVKNFDVAYNSATRVVSMTGARNYTIIGGEMVRPTTVGNCLLSNQPVTFNGTPIQLTAYNINGNNYFMIREIGALLNFGVDYDDNNNTVLVDTSKIYTPE